MTYHNHAKIDLSLVGPNHRLLTTDQLDKPLPEGAEIWRGGGMKYRNKPVVIEAMQLTKENVLDVFHWCNAKEWDTDPSELHIRTLEGTMKAKEGDWIIKGIKGEFYPCRDDIFRATYEPCGEEARG